VVVVENQPRQSRVRGCLRMADATESTVPDDPEEWLEESSRSTARLWWRLQLLGGALLTAIGLPVWVLHFVLGWSSDRIGDTATEAVLGGPIPASIWLGAAVISLALPVIATYIHARELSRRGVEVPVWRWSLVALFCTNTWPLYWVLAWFFYRYRQEVDE
jgi:hypothetical protein